MAIIALSGYARSGKDTAADVLVKEFGFRKVAFADKLREVLYALNPYVAYEGPLDKYHAKRFRVQEVIDEFGWEGYKQSGFGLEIRWLLQRLGTEAGRQTLWDSIWIDAALHDYDPAKENIVVSDARFHNEFDAIHARRGVIWRIERPGVEILDHPSETEAPTYKNFDRYIMNNRDLEYFKQAIREELSMFREQYGTKGQEPMNKPIDENLYGRPKSQFRGGSTADMPRSVGKI